MANISKEKFDSLSKNVNKIKENTDNINIKTPGNVDNDFVSMATFFGSVFIGQETDSWSDLSNKKNAYTSTSILGLLNAIKEEISNEQTNQNIAFVGNLTDETINKLCTQLNTQLTNVTDPINNTLSAILNTLVSQNNSNVNNTAVNPTPQQTTQNVQNNTNNVNSLNDILDFLDNIKDLDLSKHNKDIQKNLEIFENILIGNEYSITRIIEYVNSLSVATSNNNTTRALNNVSLFFRTISQLTEISRRDRNRIKRNIQFISKYITSDIISIINDLSQTSEQVREVFVAEGAVETVTHLFEAISVLNNIDRMNKISMKMNTLWIKNFILGDIISIINTLNESVQTYTPEALKSIDALNGIIDAIMKFGNYGFIKLIKLSIKTRQIAEIISDFISTISEEITNRNADIQNAANSVLLMYGLTTNINKIINSLPSFKKLIGSTFKLDILLTALSNIDEIVKAVNKIKIPADNTVAFFAPGGKLQNLIEYIKQSAEKLNEIKLDTLSNILKLVNQFNLIVIASGTMLLVAGLFASRIDFVALTKFTIALTMFIGGTMMVFKLFGKGLKDTLNGAEQAMQVVFISAAILLLGSYIAQYISPDSMLIFTGALTLFLLGISTVFRIFSSAYKETLEGAEGAMLVVVNAAAILIIGGLVSKSIDFALLALFGLELGIFLAALGKVFETFGESYKEAMEGAKDAVLIIGIAGAILIAGSMASKLIDFVGLITFTGSLIAFLFTIGRVFKRFGKSYEEAMEGAEHAVLIIGVCGAILLYGSLVSKLIDVEGLIAFTIMLGLFIGAICYIFTKADIKDAMKGAAEVAVLIAVSGVILLAGGAILLAYPELVAGSLIFGAILVLFIKGICWAFTSNRRNIANSMAGAAEVAILIAVSGVILLAGGAIIKNNLELVGWSILFGIMLLAFIGGLCWVYKKTERGVAQSLMGAVGVAVLLVVSGALLLFAGKFIKDNDLDILQIGGFVGLTLLLIGGVSAISVLLSRVQTSLRRGLLAMASVEALCAGVAGIVWLLGKAFTTWNETSLENINNALKYTAIVFGSVAALVTILGGIMLIPGAKAVLGVGAIVFVALEALVFGVTKIMQEIGKSIQILNSVKDVDFSQIGNVVIDFAKLSITVITAFDDISLIKVASMSEKTVLMSRAFSSLANTIRDWSSLKIPTYTGTKHTGYITLTDEDFKTAAEHIKYSVVCLSEAILQIYAEGKESGIFDTKGGILGLGGRSPFAIVVSSMKNLGVVLSSIARGVKQWADLKIPEYTGTKQTGWITLTGEHFSKAGENIRDVLIALGQAIIKTYDDAPEGMFDSNAWFNAGSKTPFAMVVRSMKTLGPTLSSIARGVKEWADLKIPNYNSNGKIIGYTTLSTKEFNTVKDNIANVVSALGGAIVDVVKKDKNDIFSVDKKTSKAAIFGKTMGYIGNVLNSTASTVYYYASGRFPITEFKDGKLTIRQSDTKVGPVELLLAAINIKHILIALGKAISEVMSDPNTSKYFAVGKNSPGAIAAKAISDTGAGLFNIVNTIDKISQMKLDVTALGQIKDKLSVVLDGVMEIISLFGKPQTGKGSEAYKKGLWRTIFSGSGKYSYAEFINAKMGSIIDAGNNLKKLQTALNNVFTSIAGILSSWDKNNGKNAVLFNIAAKNKSGENIWAIKFSRMLAGVVSIITVLSESYDSNEDILKNANKAAEKWEKIVSSTGKVIQNIVSLINGKDNKNGILDAVAGLTDGKGNSKLTVLTNFINEYKNVIATLLSTDNEKTTILESIGTLSVINEKLGSVTAVFGGYNDILSGFIQVGKDALSLNGKDNPFITLANGINKLYTTTSNITTDKIENFGKYERDMSNFTSSINRLNSTNANVLIRILTLLNRLSEQGAPISKLADAITNDLTTAYNNLGNKLDDVKTIMDKANEFQNSREKSIKKNVDEVKKLMAEHINVDIRKIDTDMSQNFGSVTETDEGDNGNNTNSTIGTSTGGGINTDTGMNTNNNQQTTQTKQKSSTGNNDMLKQSIITNAIVEALKKAKLSKI